MKKSSILLLGITLYCLITFNYSFSQNFEKLEAESQLYPQLKYTELSSIKSRGEIASYIGSDGQLYKIGDTLKIGFPSSNNKFSFITMGDGVFLPIINLDVSASGQKTEITKISIFGSKRTGFSIGFRTKGAGSVSNYNIQFENALSNGEIKGLGISSDDALNQLKKAKDKLDLGLITQEEFDKLKLELRKYIK
jgi:hypothetical protein